MANSSKQYWLLHPILLQFQELTYRSHAASRFFWCFIWPGPGCNQYFAHFLQWDACTFGNGSSRYTLLMEPENRLHCRVHLSVPRRYRFLYCPNCCTLIIQQSNKIVQEAKVPSFATDSSVRNDIENALILFRCNIPISRLCSANCGLDSYQSLKAECFIYSCKALVRKFTESVRKSNGRILLKGTNPSANVTISKVSDCS